jgi:putative membrane-bound dehydrogenase-like protein
MPARFISCRLIALLAFSICGPLALAQQKEVIPHAQDKPPGPPLSPQEAVKRMTVPEGFSVEIVAAEPDIVNPVAMTFDERGRVWITESLEYPRRSAGPGKDRVKVLEDTDGDGRADKFTVFADGLNIPSGIAVGYGGVWVANSPDILFMQDTDGDGRADKQRVVVTGFGRTDTHELPNSLTWGPDGWLYGLNGVFNHSYVRYGKDNPNYKKAGDAHPGWPLTCAMFRIHPRTWEFQVFAEGTSNPWGIAFNEDGEAFVSACVIDHLWHITETGYYHRQGGPYPPHTWKIGSIVKHKHQKAAYCGITWFDSDAYPEKYRGLLYMGNIHGGCINVDRLKRDGSTYFATPEPDFLTANDAWFMPVVQKTGPDGCLYILDWYDRYHCYQDANRDPAGIDRLKGRLYRVRYKNTPRAGKFDLGKEGDEQLMKRLGHPNVYFRETAQRVLSERLAKEPKTSVSLKKELLTLATSIRLPLPKEPKEPRSYVHSKSTRMHALWALIGALQIRHFELETTQLMRSVEYRSWVVRAVGDGMPRDGLDRAIAEQLLHFSHSGAPATKLQVAIAAAKWRREPVEFCGGQPQEFTFDPLEVLVRVLATCGDDKLIPHIVWNNLQPVLEDRASDFLALIKKEKALAAPGMQKMLPVLTDRLLARQGKDAKPVAMLLELLIDSGPSGTDGARRCLDAIAQRVQSGEIQGAGLSGLKSALEPTLQRVLSAEPRGALFMDAAFLAVTWKNQAAVDAVREVFASQGKQQPADVRLKALGALIAADAEFLEHDVDEALSDAKAGEEFRGQLLAAMGRINKPFVAHTVLTRYELLEPANKPKAIELLTQRPMWAKPLLEEIKKKRIPLDALNVNQVRRLLASSDKELVALVTKTWGTVRTERDPQRELFVDRMRYFIRRNPGDATRGLAAYNKVCGQCHKLHGQGQEVGADITLNGRSSFEQLLSNVFDPSLVIGADYQARTVITADGRSLTGLLVEDSPQRVVLKMQGGKLETVARGDIEQFGVSKLSMMPEGVEKLLQPQEMADLFALLTLDKPPSDPSAKRLSEVYDVTPQQTGDAAKFDRLLAEVAPGFSVKASGEGGVALLREHAGRKIVVRTHPPQRGQPCVLQSKVAIPKGQRTRLLLAVSHDPRGDWQLVVKANGQTVHESLIGPKTTKNGWADVSIDLSSHAGREVQLELENRPTGWEWEFGYWGGVEIQ